MLVYRFVREFCSLTQPWIKICGVTQNKDADYAAELGVNALGFVFYSRSPRAISSKILPNIIKNLQGSVNVVALFVNPTKDEVSEVLDSGLIDLIQFHGNESEEFCCSFDIPYMKVLHIKDQLLPLTVFDNYLSARYLLLDTFSKKMPGGTGKTFDWSIAKDAVKKTNREIVIAGGLTPANVEYVVKTINPFGVDVSSGVESAQGKKDMNKLDRFIRGARSVRS